MKFTINIAKIITATALSVMTSLSIPIVGEFLAGVVIAAGIVELGIAIDQRNKIASLASGGYTGTGYGQADETGYKPAGVVHENEYVIPAWQGKDPVVANAIKIIEAHRVTHTYVGAGNANAGTGITNPREPAGPSFVGFDERTLEVMDKHTKAMERIIEEGIKGKWVYTDFKQFEERTKKSIDLFTT